MSADFETIVVRGAGRSFAIVPGASGAKLARPWWGSRAVKGDGL
jgi:hypothetical protein